MIDAGYDPRFLEGIRYFNECEFFEAHEVWEDLWKDDTSGSREFYQGLIQVVVCLHHFGNGNTRGAVKLFHSSSNHLQPFMPWHLGLDLEKLLADLRTCCKAILDSEELFPKVAMDPDKIPEIQLTDRVSE